MEFSLESFIVSNLFLVLLVFCRVGTAFLFMPGIGESYISPRIKILFAVALSIALSVYVPFTPFVPDDLGVVVGLIFFETVVGLWIGVVSRIILTSLQYAGFIAGQVSALANAFAPNVGAFEGATVLSSFLLLGGVMVVFAADLHHLIIQSFVMSYDVFPLGEIFAGDMANQTAKALSASTYIGFVMAAPFLVMGVIFNVGLGLANRMMPTLPVFFVATSVLIALGILIMSMVVPNIINLFIENFAQFLKTLTF